MTANYLPNLPGIKREVRRGRCVRDGYQRGWGLQFTPLARSVSADETYAKAMQLAGPRIVQGPLNGMNIFLILKFFLNELPAGDIVEFGSYKGGSAIFMASVLQDLYPGRVVYALDTFAGMPATEKQVDAHNAGDFADTDYEEVQRYARSVGLTNIRFVKGLFEDSWPAIKRENKPAVALAHIDCDIKSAVAYSYHAVKPSMVQGGYIVFDDANVSSCIGATEAVEEIIQQESTFSEQIWPHFVFRHDLGK